MNTELHATDLAAEMARRMKLGIRPGIERMELILQELGDPQSRLGAVVLVAGTNGKGSTCAFLDSVLRQTGKRVAFYCSPHLVRFTERIQLDGREVPLDALEASLQRTLAAERQCHVGLTGFELVTAVAFDYLASQKPDFSVIEVGMGGRYDATNVVTPSVSVVTAVGMDHMEYLGETLARIAWEKAGILRRGVPVVVGFQPEEALLVLGQEAQRLGCQMLRAGREFEGSGTTDEFCFAGQGVQLAKVSLGLKAHYQIENAAVALAAVISLLPQLARQPELMRKGLAKTSWPGRFDHREWKGVPILLDGAHNVPGMVALRRALEARWPGEQFRVLYSCKAGKQTKEVLEVLGPLVASAVVTSLPRLEGVVPDEMAALFPPGVPVEVVMDPDRAWNRWLEGPDRPLRLCCGSLYLVGYYLSLFESLSCGSSEETPCGCSR